MKSNYMRAAELKAKKLDSLTDSAEIAWLYFEASLREAILEQILKEQEDFGWLEKIATFKTIKEDNNELRNM